MAEFGVRMTPDLGKNTKFLIEQVQSAVLPVPSRAEAVRSLRGPADFMKQNFFGLTAKQLVDRIFTEPNLEYYYRLITLPHITDLLLLGASIEMG